MYHSVDVSYLLMNSARTLSILSRAMLEVVVINVVVGVAIELNPIIGQKTIQ